MSLSLGSRFWGSCNAVILTLPDRGVANAFVVAGDTDLMLAHSFREFPRSKTLTLYLVACDGWRPFTRTFFSSGDALPLSFFSGVLFHSLYPALVVDFSRCSISMRNTQLYRLDVERMQCSFYT